MKAQRDEGLGDVIHLRGCIEIALKDARDESVLDYQKIDNVVVTAGRRWVLERIKSESPPSSTINSIAIGTSTTAPATGDTALGSEVTASLGRKTIGTFTTTNLTSNPPSWRAEVNFATNEGNATIGEAGIFNTSAATAGTMLGHVTFGTINKTTSNTLSVSYTLSN